MPGYTGVLLEMPKTWMQAALGIEQALVGDTLPLKPKP
jgi:hypothetical protein